MVQTISEFYAGQKILVTGGSGYMGKVLIEKLLRSCPDLDTIYMIIRSKKGKSIEERWAQITSLPLFDKLKSTRPENLNKVRLIPGELSREDLGISNEHRKELKENTSLVFHVAADVQFSESLNDALIQNVKATKTMLDFALTLKNLKAFVYLSTAYCNFNRPPKESIEEILPACQDWRTLLKLQETQSSVLLALHEKLLCGHPNTYTWSKSLAEQVVKEYSKHIPTAVLRPAVVVGTIREDPLVGWNDSLLGFTAVGLGVYCGVLRVMRGELDSYMDFIPVDLATKAQIIACKKAADKGKGLEVYNCSTAAIYPATFEDMLSYADRLDQEYPISKKIWTNDCTWTTNPFKFYFSFFYKQLLPFVFLDLCLKIARQETRFIKMAKKIANADRLFARFTGGKIMFPNNKYQSLENYLCEKDKKDFSIDVSDLLDKVQDVCYNLTVGSLKYAAKEDFSPEAIRRNKIRIEVIKILKMVTDVVQYGIFGIVTWYLLLFIIERN